MNLRIIKIIENHIIELIFNTNILLLNNCGKYITSSTAVLWTQCPAPKHSTNMVRKYDFFIG